jgi:hypothetical protein
MSREAAKALVRTHPWWLLSGAVVAALVVAAGTLLLVVGGDGSTTGPPELAKCATSISISPTPQPPGAATSVFAYNASAAVGQRVDSVVVVDIGTDDTVNAFDLTVHFDPKVAAVASICLDNGWARSLTASWDNASGTLRVAAFQLGRGCTADAPCSLFKVTWSGLSRGLAQLTFDGTSLAGAHGQTQGVLPGVEFQPGSVAVN